MTGWRDDLPPIPTERIRTAAIREGSHRRDVRARRQRAVLYGGAGTAVVALIVLIAVQSEGPSERAGDGDAASATTSPDATAEATAAAATTEAAAETTSAPATEAPTTGAPETTAAAEETATAPETETTAVAAATTVPHTTVPGSIAAMPVSDAVIVTRPMIWEQPASGANCGPITSVVQMRVPDVTPGTPVVHWEVAGMRGEAPMEVRGQTAIATIGPFPSDTLASDTTHEVLVYLTDAERFGDEIFRAPPVILQDCSA